MSGLRQSHISCTVADRPLTNWVCDAVLTLKAGPHTERGTVVTTGIYASPEDGTDSDVFAVTGGTGAYENVRGHATQDEGSDSYTLHLIP